jgi:hypothetical protein
MLSMLSVAEPVLLTMTGCSALGEPTGSVPKVRLVTDRSAVGEPPQALSRQTAPTASKKCLFILPPGRNPSTTVRGKVGGYD